MGARQERRKNPLSLASSGGTKTHCFQLNLVPVCAALSVVMLPGFGCCLNGFAPSATPRRPVYIFLTRSLRFNRSFPHFVGKRVHSLKRKKPGCAPKTVEMLSSDAPARPKSLPCVPVFYRVRTRLLAGDQPQLPARPQRPQTPGPGGQHHQRCVSE